MTEQGYVAAAEARLEQYDEGEVLYLAVDPDGVWARSEFPDDLVTIDYDAEGRVVGIEIIGKVAHTARAGLLHAISRAEALSDPRAVSEAIGAVLADT